MKQAARGLALSAEERRTLLILIEKMGERAVLAELHVSRQALGRALAGLGVRRGTVALVRAGLASPNLQAGLENSAITTSGRPPSQGGRNVAIAFDAHGPRARRAHKALVQPHVLVADKPGADRSQER